MICLSPWPCLSIPASVNAACLIRERSASRSFLDQMVREDTDKAFVIHFDREVELLQDLTPSHEKLEASLDSLQTPQFTQDPQDTPSSGPNHRAGRGEPGAAAVLCFTTQFIWPPMN